MDRPRFSRSTFKSHRSIEEIVPMTPLDFSTITSRDFLATAARAVEPYDFVEHYTSPKGALNILRSKQIWFTNVSNMNDISEMLGGCQVAYQATQQQIPSLFSAFGDFGTKVLAEFDNRFRIVHRDTYAFCLSGHDPDQGSGRLAMWRSYGADGAGVCLVLKRHPIIQMRIMDFPINWVPMICEAPNDLAGRVAAFLKTAAQTLSANPNLLKDHFQEVVTIVAHTLLLFGVAHKHIQFSYEQEIRLVHMKAFQSPILDKMTYDAEVIRGTLQPLFKVNLADYADFGLPGTQLPDLLERILIGPSPMAEMQGKALDHVLKANGLPNVPVTLCDIPYRSLNQS